MFDDEPVVPLDRSATTEALAILWVCTDYLCRLYEQSLFSGSHDELGFRKPGSLQERAIAEEYARRVRFAAQRVAVLLGATRIETEVIRNEPYKCTWEQLQSKAAAQETMLRMLEERILDSPIT